MRSSEPGHRVAVAVVASGPPSPKGYGGTGGQGR